MAQDKSKTILTKYGKKGKSISFDLEKRNEFINGFGARKKERRERSTLKKKLKEKKFIEDVKKDAKETIQRHVKTINEICRQNHLEPTPKNEMMRTTSKVSYWTKVFSTKKNQDQNKSRCTFQST
ncbi:hypothetical protein FG379_000522 [Cryptosporidium bovis]|uniref:uncharacterized protein n=1 Tax=Cryptosporidium bovis TaxID=310047 RepID=UPI00351A857E|nr:hypothetical protein FG379_000522 [Cryptosporidium bovis]